MNNIKYKLKLLDATDVLVAINILMFALTLLYSRGLQPNTQALVDFGGNATSYMKYGHEYWRFLLQCFACKYHTSFGKYVFIEDTW